MLENRRSFQRAVKVLLFSVVACAIAAPFAVQGTESKSETDSKVAHARKTVRMLDDIYKTAVVLITKTYVEDDSSTPAIEAAMALWEAMESKGWHKARLVDVTGDPYNSDNVAQSEFEKRSLKLLSADRPYIDQVSEEDGKPILEVVTAVPVVMEKCTLCHDNYKNVKPGQVVGAISYRIPIE